MANFGLKIRDSKNYILYKYFIDKDYLNILDELYKKRIKTRDINVEFELDILENEILLLIDKTDYTEDEEVLLNNIKNYYNSRIDNNFFNLFYLFSPIFNDKECFKKIFGFLERSIIKKQRRVLKDKIRDIAKDLINDSNHLNTSKHVLFEYLTSNYVDREDELLIDKIIDKIINEEIGLDYYETKFFLRIINKRQSEKYKYEACKVYLDNSIPYVQKESLKLNKTNQGNHAFGIIVINSDFLNIKKYNVNKKGLLLLTEFVSHESFHYKQLYDFYHFNPTIDALAYLFEVTVYDDRKQYEIDYPFLPVEYLANKRYGEELKEISKEYFKENNDNKYNNFINKVETTMSYGCSSASLEYPPMIDTYLVKELSTKIKDKAIIIMLSPFLKLFFKEDGNLKSFNELVNSYTKDEYFNIFFPFFTYTLNEDIDTYDIKVIKILSLMAKNEALAINKMLYNYEYFYDFYDQKLDKKHTFNQDDVIKERLNRYNKYISLINNKVITDKLETIINKELLNKYIGKSKSYN